MADKQAPSPEPDRRARSWRPTGTARKTGESRASSRLTKILVLSVVLLALIGALAAWLLMPSPFPTPYFLTILMTDYRDRHFPPLPFDQQDSTALLQRFVTDHASQAFNSQQRDQLTRTLAELHSRQEPAVVVHLRAHAVARGDEVYLIPGDAKADEQANWLPLKDVLEALERCPARHKLLLLDAMGPLADPRLGVLADDVAGRIEDLVAARPVCVVMCACSRGQVSLTSEELGRSVFGYYLERGLSGWADGQGPSGKSDAQVSVKELFAYVKSRVERWSAQNRGQLQTPILLGQDDDFPLVQIKADKPAAPEPPSPEEYRPWLSQGWQLRDDWWKDETFRYAPLAFRELEAQLVRAEQRWRGGDDASLIEKDWQADLQRLKPLAKTARDRALPSNPPKPRSLAVENRKVDDALLASLRSLLGKLDLPPADFAKLEATFVKECAEKKLAFPDLANLCFEEAATDEVARPDMDRLDCLNRLLKTMQTTPPTWYVETILLDQLNSLAKKVKRKDRWPSDHVQYLLQTVREEERAVAGDPRAMPWFHKPLDEIAEKRRAAEAQFFSGRWDEARPALEEIRRQAHDISEHLEAIKRAQLYSDRAAVLLPSYLEYLQRRGEVSDEPDRAFENAVRAARDLRKLLETPATAAPPPPEDLNQKRVEVDGYLSKLYRPFTKEQLQRWGERINTGGPSDYLALQTLLYCPRLELADRLLVLDTGRQLGRHLLQQTLEQDHAEEGGPPTGTPVRPEFATGLPEPAHAGRRARLTLALLELGGLSGIDAMKQELNKVGPDLSGAASQSLGDQLRTAWGERLPKQYQSERSLAVKDRLSQALHPFDAADIKDASVASLRRQEIQDHWNWLYLRYQAESQALSDQEEFRKFYSDASRDYQDKAR
jgi:hypothetical protein